MDPHKWMEIWICQREDTETVRCPRGYPQSRFGLEHSGLLFGAAKSPAWYWKAWGGGEDVNQVRQAEPPTVLSAGILDAP